VLKGPRRPETRSGSVHGFGLVTRGCPRALALATAIGAAGLVIGCGSGKTSGTGSTAGSEAAEGSARTAATATQPTATGQSTLTAQQGATQPQAPAESAVTSAFGACMSRAHWRASENPPADVSVRAMRAQPGYRRAVAITDGHGNRVVAVLFASGGQAENAQLAVARVVPGNGHASVAPGTGIAWINYSGLFDVDRKVADCALAAAHA